MRRILEDIIEQSKLAKLALYEGWKNDTMNYIGRIQRLILDLAYIEGEDGTIINLDSVEHLDKEEGYWLSTKTGAHFFVKNGIITKGPDAFKGEEVGKAFEKRRIEPDKMQFRNQKNKEQSKNNPSKKKNPSVSTGEVATDPKESNQGEVLEESASSKDINETARNVVRDNVENVRPYYDNGEGVAQNFEALRSYLEHGEGHVEEVIIKADEARSDISSMVNSQDPDEKERARRTYTDIDEGVVACSAVWHDTGMDGDSRVYVTGVDGKDRPYKQGEKLAEGEKVYYLKENGEKDEKGEQLRKDHPINSAIHMLENRESLEAQGMDVEEVVMAVILHSKSNAGTIQRDELKYEGADPSNPDNWYHPLDEDGKPVKVKLGSAQGIENASKKLEKFIRDYNENNPDKKLSFDYSKFGLEFDANGEMAGTVDKTQENIKRINTIVASLRVGDANRNGKFDMITQNASRMAVDIDDFTPDEGFRQVERARVELGKSKDSMTLDDKALAEASGIILYKVGKKTEVSHIGRGATVFLESQDGTVQKMGDTDVNGVTLDPDGFSRVYAVGEGNMKKITTGYDEKTRSFVERVEIRDINKYPYATMKCLEERIGELDTLSNLKREVRVKIRSSQLRNKEVIEAWKEFGRQQTDKSKIKIVLEGIEY